MPNIPVSNCCGCTACASICPVGAIEMKPDTEGFMYPKVDSQRCLSCGKCERVCPVNFPPALPETYSGAVVAQSTEEEVLRESTSGGFIDALIRHVLAHQAGVAVGVTFDQDFMPVHKIVDSYEEAIAFRNSKYAQSDLQGVFPEIKGLLRQGRTVVFVGTPCQVAGLKCFLEGQDDGLITVDLVCRSIPSAKLWKRYLEFQESSSGAAVLNVSCRKKTYGYHSGALEIRFSNGKRYAGSNRVDYYMKCFHHDICSRPSCYRCPFKTPHRCSDLTVFDSWNPGAVTKGPLEDDDRGFSNVIAHTEKGSRLIGSVSLLRTYPADPEKMFLYTGGMERSSIGKKPERDTFYRDLEEIGFYDTVRKYVEVTGKDRIIEAAKPLWYRLKKILRCGRSGQ